MNNVKLYKEQNYARDLTPQGAQASVNIRGDEEALSQDRGENINRQMSSPPGIQAQPRPMTSGMNQNGKSFTDAYGAPVQPHPGVPLPNPSDTPVQPHPGVPLPNPSDTPVQPHPGVPLPNPSGAPVQPHPGVPLPNPSISPGMSICGGTGPAPQGAQVMYQNYPGGQGPSPSPAARPDTEYTKRMKEGFGFFGLGSILLACLYTFCMFRNGSGVTFPFFVAGSLLFSCLCLSKLGISLKKGSCFYMAGIMLLAVSTFCTDDMRIISLNKLGIFLLIISLLLNQLYDTSDWKLGKYLGSILTVSFASLGELDRPFTDGARYCRTHIRGRKSKVMYAVVGIAIASPMFVIVFALLASADAVFRSMTRELLNSIRPWDILLIMFMTTFLFLASYCILSYFCKKTLREDAADHRKGEPVLAISITGILTLIYLLFSGIQIVYLFLGKMQLPDGYTYAAYAREGFFQLLAVSVLNLIIVLVGLNYFKESRVLKAVLTVMSLCTFVMMASSALRMIIYIKYYYLTFLRIFVLWSLAVLFLLFAGVIVNIFRERFSLFRYGMCVITVFYLALSFGRPDYWIARVNVANIIEEGQQAREGFFKGEGYEDFYYLSSLSADAAPVLIPYLESKGAYELMEYDESGSLKSRTDGVYRHIPGSRTTVFISDNVNPGSYYLRRMADKIENVSLRKFNVSRYMAGAALQESGQ